MAGEEPDRAARILSAADDLFCERGYDGVSIRDVARQAGVNKALVFYYYESKIKLFERVLVGYYEAHAEVFKRAAEDASGDLRARIHGLIDTYFDFIGAHLKLG